MSTIDEGELDRLEGLYADGCHGDGWRVECCHEATNGRYSRGGCCSAPSVVTTTDQGKQIVTAQMISDDAEFIAAVHNAFPALLAAARALSAERAEVARLRAALTAENDDICQTLGKVLGYPWFKDDQENFPGATEEAGVCVGDHVAASIAAEAARRFSAEKAAREEAERRYATTVEFSDAVSRRADELQAETARLRELVKEMEEALAVERILNMTDAEALAAVSPEEIADAIRIGEAAIRSRGTSNE